MIFRKQQFELTPRQIVAAGRIVLGLGLVDSLGYPVLSCLAIPVVMGKQA